MAEHSCKQCEKASTWCTATDPWTGVPAYRGQYDYLERMFERQHHDIQLLVTWLKEFGQDVSRFEHQDSGTQRYIAWKNARLIQPNRPWDKEDQQANLTKDRVIGDSFANDLTDTRPRLMDEVMDDNSIPSTSSTQYDLSTFIHQPSLGLPEHSGFSTSINMPNMPGMQADFDDYNQVASLGAGFYGFHGLESEFADQLDLDESSRARM